MTYLEKYLERFTDADANLTIVRHCPTTEFIGVEDMYCSGCHDCAQCNNCATCWNREYKGEKEI